MNSRTILPEGMPSIVEKTGRFDLVYELGYKHPCDFSRAWSLWQAKVNRPSTRDPSASARSDT